MRTIKVLCVMGALFFANALYVNAAPTAATEAMSVEQAKTFIQSLGEDALNIINRKGISSSEVCTEFKKLLEKNLAVENIEKWLLGNFFKQLNNELAFKNSLINMLVNMYTSRFNEYKAAKFTVTFARKKTSKQILVDSKISLPGKQNIKITWIIFVSAGKIYDVKIDGVSIGKIQRTIIREKIAKSGFQKFLEDFIRQHRELKATNESKH